MQLAQAAVRAIGNPQPAYRQPAAPFTWARCIWNRPAATTVRRTSFKSPFKGRAPGTQLTQIVINGDKDHNGKYSSGEVFFDTAPGGQGVFGSAPFKVVQSNGFTVNSTQVVDGGQQLVINLHGFVAGDKLIFSIDVDEVQYVDPTTGQICNAVVEGDEFQRSILTGTFIAPHFQDTSGNALFWDEFDQNFADANASSGTTLDLPSDSYVPRPPIKPTSPPAPCYCSIKSRCRLAFRHGLPRSKSRQLARPASRASPTSN